MSGKTEPDREQTEFRSAVVLAGGRGRRIGMVEKSLLKFEEKTILERLLESLFRAVDEVILSVRDKTQEEKFRPALEKFPACEIRFCFDTLEDAGPLEGIRAGLLESRAEYSFVCAGDMPFVNSRVVDRCLRKQAGTMLPFLNGRIRSSNLCMRFTQKLIPEIEKAFEKGKRSVLTPVFEMKDVVLVDVSEIRRLILN